MIADRAYPAREHPQERALTVSLSEHWNGIGLGLILGLAALLNVYGLSQEGYPNTYYAAAVKSMTENWHAFFFTSLDPAGFVSVDKPPLGFWLQVLSVKLFGYSGITLILPQALAGVASVALLYVVVSRTFGRPAGLLAALALAITPVSVVTNRNNTIDSTLVLLVLLGAWAITRAIETGRLRWLLLCAVFVGLGFNIKMLQAYLVLPAFGLTYILGVRLGWWKRFGHLALATVVLVVVSLSWVIAVDLVPAALRPWIGSTDNNSELSLALGYNGLSRLAGTINFATGGVAENGPMGVLRLLDTQLGGQIGWLLPLALIGCVVAAWQTRRHRSRDGMGALPHRVRLEARPILDGRQSALVMWGMWFLTMDVFFDIAGFYHTYYLVMIAPAIAALSGIGLVALWRAYRAPGDKTGWLLPASLLAVAAVQVYLLRDYSAWATWLDPLIVGLALLGVLILTVLRLRRQSGTRLAIAALLLGVAALLAAPAAWSVETVYAANGGNLPTAGPRPSATGFGSARSGSGRFGGAGFGSGGAGDSSGPPRGGFPFEGGRSGTSGGRFGGSGSTGGPFGRSGSGEGPSGRPGLPGGGFQPPNGTFPSGRDGIGGGFGGSSSAVQVNQAMLTYLEAHQGSATYLFATTNVHIASDYIIATGKPVMAMGGFTGSDPILTPAKLATLAQEGKVKYFLIAGSGTGGSGNSSLTTWIQQHTTLITVGGAQLYEYTG